MQKNYVRPEDIKVIVRNMPPVFRELYADGREIRVHIIRKQQMKKYGRELNVRLWRDVLIDADIKDAETIIGSFLYGTCVPIVLNMNHRETIYTGDFGIRFSL